MRGGVFHKMNLTAREFKRLLHEAGLEIEHFDAVQNMPLLYKFRIFRASGHRDFDETKARSEGYRLSWLGSHLQRILMMFPHSFCNLYVAIGRKPEAGGQ